MSTVVAKVHCTNPNHQDDKPSLAVYSDGHGYCFGCGTYFPDFAEEQPEKVQLGKTGPGEEPLPLPWSLAKAYQDLLYGLYKARLAYLYGRGLWDATVRRFMLGHSGRGFSIPNWNSRGELLSIKYRRDDHLEDEEGPKYWGVRGYNQVSLYPAWREVKDKTILLCEGELDVIRLTQCVSEYSEFVPLTVTGGASSIPSNLLEVLQQAKAIYIIYDQDEAGQTGSYKIRQRIAWTTPVRNVTWPAFKECNDVTDFLNKFGSKALFSCLPAI